MTPFYGPLAHLNQIFSDKHKYRMTQYCYPILLLAKRRGQCKNCDFLRLSVSDFYRNVLGFQVGDDWDGYIITRKDQIEIHLWQCEDENLPKNTGCYIRYGRNIEELYLKYSKEAIIHKHGKLELKPWGMKQFSILDNSGNIIHIGQNA